MACTTIASFTSNPNGGSVDMSSAFAPGAAGAGSSTRRYQIVGYNNGWGADYGGGTVGSDGSLSTGSFGGGPGSGTFFDPNNQSFTSDYSYPEHMCVIVSEEGEECSPAESGCEPCNCPEPEYSEPEPCADEICVGESKVVMRTLLNGGDFDECCEQPLPEVAQTINGTFSPLITVNFTSGVAGKTAARGEMCFTVPGCPESTIECVPVITGGRNGGGLEDGVYTTPTNTVDAGGSFGGWKTGGNFTGTGNRTGIRIHPDGGPAGTAGCIGITGGSQTVRDALDAMNEAGDCGGAVEVSVTTAPGVTRRVGRTVNGVPVESEQTTIGSSGTNCSP